MATLTPGSNLTSHVAHSEHVPQVSHLPKSYQEFGQVFILLPARIIDDRKNGSRVRVLAWLISHGMRSNHALPVTLRILGDELQLSVSTIHDALHDLARSGYLEVLLDPKSRGHSYSYRLTPLPEGGK